MLYVHFYFDLGSCVSFNTVGCFSFGHCMGSWVFLFPLFRLGMANGPGWEWSLTRDDRCDGLIDGLFFGVVFLRIFCSFGVCSIHVDGRLGLADMPPIDELLK
jgi:hypothetical protein